MDRLRDLVRVLYTMEARLPGFIIASVGTAFYRHTLLLLVLFWLGIFQASHTPISR